jgi:hypothetical protein
VCVCVCVWAGESVAKQGERLKKTARQSKKTCHLRNLYMCVMRTCILVLRRWMASLPGTSCLWCVYIALEKASKKKVSSYLSPHGWKKNKARRRISSFPSHIHYTHTWYTYTHIHSHHSTYNKQPCLSPSLFTLISRVCVVCVCDRVCMCV